MDFGGGLISTPVSATDVFSAKYNSEGTHIWSKKLGAPALAFGYAACVDGSDNVIVSGFFQGTATGDGQSITSAGGSDIFAVKFSNAGIRQWTRSFGGPGADIGYGLSRDSTGALIVTGGYSNNAVFNGATFTSSGAKDVFVLKLTP